MLAIVLLLHGLLMPHAHGVSSGDLSPVCTSIGMQWVEVGPRGEGESSETVHCVWCQLQGALLPAAIAPAVKALMAASLTVASPPSAAFAAEPAFARPPSHGPPAATA
jgi:hypothetical protein